MSPDTLFDTGIEMEDIPPDIIENDDGSATVIEEMGVPEAQEFDTNLAEVFSNGLLSTISHKLLDLIEQDQKIREKRDKQYEEGLKRSGLGEDAPGGAEFEGASRVVHPMLAEACVDFESSAIKELFPPNGPVRPKLVGVNMTPERQAKAQRMATHMNWQLTEQMPEYRHELEQMLTQLPMGGSQYMKLYQSSTLGRPVSEAVFVDDIFLPYNANGFYAADRMTHRQYLSVAERAARMASGFYRDLSEPPPTTPALSKAAQANNKIEGRHPTGDDDDQVVIYEVYTSWDMEGEDPLVDEGEIAPYIITIDEDSKEVLNIFRNWDERDPRRQKLDWIVEYNFIPWRGAYGIGLPHLIGSLSAAATGALRALLDTAHANNSLTAIKVGAAKPGGQTTNPSIGTVSTLEGIPPGSDLDIRKVIMPVPFNPPSAVLFELLGWLTDAAKGVVSTAEEKIADATNNMPVGTAQALIEQGAKVFSAIHARMHASQARFLKILARLNRDYLDDSVTQFEAGEVLASRQDYQGPADVIPVSDPNIFSQTQRYAQNAALGTIAQQFPMFFDMRAVVKRQIETLQVPNVDEVMPPPPQPMPMDPVSENLMMSQSAPVQAFPQQDHLGHLLVHLAYLDFPMLGANPVVGINYIPQAMEHIAQHLGLFYAETMFQVAGGQFQPGQPLPPEMDMQVTRKLGQGLPQVLMAMQENLADMPRVINDAIARLQKYQQMQRAISPQPPTDPLAEATIEASLAETQRKAKADEMDAINDARKAGIEQRRLDIEEEKVDLKAAEVGFNAAHEQEKTIVERRRADFQTALDMADRQTPDDDDEMPRGAGPLRAR